MSILDHLINLTAGVRVIDAVENADAALHAADVGSLTMVQVPPGADFHGKSHAQYEVEVIGVRKKTAGTPHKPPAPPAAGGSTP